MTDCDHEYSMVWYAYDTDTQKEGLGEKCLKCGEKKVQNEHLYPLVVPLRNLREGVVMFGWQG